MSNCLWLVDASVYVFRAWHSMPDEQADADGHPVGAVHGFARFLLELLERQQPSHLAVAFDEALESSFRNRLYPPYKANREPAPEALKRQFGYCKQFAAALGLSVMSDDQYEADDLIGSLLTRQRRAGFRGVIVSADKDLSQLLVGDDEQWDYARNLRWNVAGVPGRYGVRADQIADFLGLAGDAVDNIPGVPGIGIKTAAALLAHFDTLDGLLARIDELPFLRIRGAAAHAARLRAHSAQALLSRQLATIECAAALDPAIGDAERRPGDADALHDLLDRLRFGPMTRRRVLEAAAVSRPATDAALVAG
jgi:DNA polymerase I